MAEAVSGAASWGAIPLDSSQPLGRAPLRITVPPASSLSSEQSGGAASWGAIPLNEDVATSDIPSDGHAEPSTPYGPLTPRQEGRATQMESGSGLAAVLSGLATGASGNLTDYPPALAAGVRGLIGGEGFSAPYNAQLENMRGQREGLEEKYPGTSLASNIAGAIAPAVPAGGLVRGATLLPRMVQSGVIGGLYGGLQGGAGGEGLEDRARRAGEGAVIGAPLGAVGEAGITGATSLWGKMFGGAKTAAPGVVPAERAAAAGEFNIPLSRGQAIGNVEQQAFEEAARNSARGPEAGAAVRGFDARQQAAIQAAQDSVSGNLGGAATRAPEAGGAIQQGLKDAAGGLRQEADAAYKRAAQKDVWISAPAVSELGRSVGAKLAAEGVQLNTHGNYAGSQAAMNLLRRVASFEDTGPQAAKSLMDVDQVRRTLTTIKATNREDGRALKFIKDGFDDWFTKAVDTKLFSGDATALTDLKQARPLWAQYRRLTDGGRDDASKIISKIVTESRTGEEVANWLLGTSSAQQAGLASRLAQQLKTHLGTGSDEWNALRQAAWDKMVTPTRGQGTQAKVSSIIDFTRGKGAPLAKELFTPEELGVMTRLAAVMKSTITDPRATNRGQSGYEIARMLGGPTGMAAAAGGVGAAIWNKDPRYLALAALPLLRSTSSLSKGMAATRALPSPAGATLGTGARTLNLIGAGQAERAGQSQ